MPAQLLATGTSVASSSDLVVTSGSSVTVGLKDLTLPSKVVIELKDDAGTYTVVGDIDTADVDAPVVVITAPGTYRFTRVRGSCGVFSG